MHTAKRRFEPAVIERLFAEPFRFQFFQAVRMVELWLRRNGVAQEGAIANFMRFQNSVTLRFPASQLETLHPEPREILPTAPALMGNTVIWKPASSAMFSAHYIMALLRAAGLPPGVINLVAGDASLISRELRRARSRASRPLLARSSRHSRCAMTRAFLK